MGEDCSLEGKNTSLSITIRSQLSTGLFADEPVISLKIHDYSKSL